MASKFNILNSDPACISCVKSYSKKHDLKSGDLFNISCIGIPKEYISPAMAESVPSEELISMQSMLDPVTWAAQVLDWHCIDPLGEVWKRKTQENSLDGVDPYIEEQHKDLIKQGKSPYNRPYQSTMLRCSSKRKVFRMGRQLGKSETLTLAILHTVFTHRDYKIIIVTPYQTQIDLIFLRLEKLIKSKVATSNSLKRYVKAPNYTMELHNGSTIKGFTAGTKSGGNADSVRGQKANMLVVDECDYLNSGDMASILSVITNHPNATVWLSSTPTGKRERFYDTCHDPSWKEFYYPSQKNPLWSDDLEKFYKSQFNSIEYAHEVLADFGEQAQGVYQSKYVDECLTDYKYEEQRPNSNWQYCIGVDWNDVKIGTTISVLGYNPTINIFRLMERHVVSREGWTQTAACNEIVRLNAEWLPQWIYIDKGFGSSQDEILRKFGWDSLANPEKGKNHPDSRLSRIVKTYDFGSKVITKDLFTKQDRDKPAKPFLVENSVRRFEQRQIQISKYDTQLESELRGYIIDHVTSTGMPVYKQGNEKVGDHNLDALNLALVAFTLEMSPFGQVRYDTSIAFAGSLERGSSATTANRSRDNGTNKPTLDRTVGIEKQPGLFQVPDKQPAAHTRLDTGQKLWVWPGFERDQPRPKPRTRSTRSPNYRPQPPSRKKF